MVNPRDLIGSANLEAAWPSGRPLDDMIVEPVYWGAVRIQVVHRKGRVVHSRKDSGVVAIENHMKQPMGSRFTSLATTSKPEGMVIAGSAKVVPEVSVTMNVTPIVLSSELVEDIGAETSVQVASKDSIVPVVSSLSRDKHAVVQVVDSREDCVLKEKNGRVLPNSIKGLIGKVGSKSNTSGKGIQRQGLKLKKRSEKGVASPALATRMSALVSKLDRATETTSAGTGEFVRTPSAMDGDVDWMANTTFVAHDGAGMHV
ncbi:hypothetical protein V6N12_067959 [Hibiscus sabdariffa]|uniref:Uncharacterized protein n=1 Tax=Hibiscus sabdariffa TaxID=183260 RepID=A0ABR2FNX2_9ROSI